MCEQLLRIYKGLIRPCLEYCSHVWGDLLQLISLTGWSQKHSVLSTHLISPHSYPHWSCAAMLLLSLSFTGTISVVVRMSFIIVSLVLKTGVAILDLLLPRMNFAWRLATRASIGMVPASFHTQVNCGILCLLQFFLPLTICLPLKVGCTSTSWMTDLFHFSLCNILKF